jgi:hypothetical protein
MRKYKVTFIPKPGTDVEKHSITVEGVSRENATSQAKMMLGLFDLRNYDDVEVKLANQKNNKAARS